MPTFIIRIDEKDLQRLRGEGTEYYESDVPDERPITEAIANYPLKTFDADFVKVMKVE